MATIPANSFPIIFVYGLLLLAVFCVRKLWLATALSLANSCRIINFGSALIVREYLESGFDFVCFSYFVTLVALFETAVVARRPESISKNSIVFMTEVTIRSWTLAAHVLMVIVAKAVHFHPLVFIVFADDGRWNTPFRN